MKLTWQHTLIGGETRPYDYCARDGGTQVGRIMKIEHGPAAGEWSWSMYAKAGWAREGLTTHGREDTKQAAADKVSAVYGACIACPTFPENDPENTGSSDC
ncbi:MAG: hypothetical protein WCZ28_06165 [Burkholderiaceae bacterium]